MRRRPIILAPALLAVAALIGAGILHLTRDADAAAVLFHASADCSGAPPSVTLTWSPDPSASGQRLEISAKDDGFSAGSFTSINLASDQASHTLPALNRNGPHFWRIVSTTGQAETVSETKTFVPCGPPFLLWGPMECRNFASASVSFRWAPVANYTGEQWIEFDSDGDWEGDDFWRAGPYSPGQEAVRRSGFLDGVGYLFRIVRETGETRQVSSTGWFQPDCTPDISSSVYGSDDRLYVPSIGVDAPINVRDVGWDAALGVPISGEDVVRYEFKTYPHLAGTVGGAGPKVIGGHLDFYVGPAVFWDLAKVKAGDEIRYQDGDQTYIYVVDWVTQVPYTEPLNSYIEAAEGDEIFLITCFGVFDRDQFGGYDRRTIVHGTRQ